MIHFKLVVFYWQFCLKLSNLSLSNINVALCAENLAPSELKKLKNKQRKKAKKEEEHKHQQQHKTDDGNVKDGATQPHKETKGKDAEQDGPKEVELVPEKLVRVSD